MSKSSQEYYRIHQNDTDEAVMNSKVRELCAACGVESATV
jgi:hypothetical protein